MIEINNLEKLLEPELKENTKIVKYSTNRFIPAGENYGSEIIAVSVCVRKNDEQEEVKEFVAKMKPLNEDFGIMCNIQFTFKREMNMYLDIIPTLISFQKECKIKENNIINCFPKYFAARLNLNSTDVLDENGLILLENLKTSGFIMKDRMTGFDLNHSELIIKNLACFHAAPIALKYLKPEVYNKKIVNLEPYIFGDCFTNEMKNQFLTQLFEIIMELEDCQKYAKKIVDCVDRGFKFEERFLEPKGLYLSVAHNDLWVNNIMCLEDKNGHPIKCKFYDLQMASYASIAHDLLFFLFTSTQPEVFSKHYNDLIKLYYDSLLEYLKEYKLDLNLFSWESFIEELNQIGPYQMSHIVIMFRPIFMEKNKIQSMVEMKQNDMSNLHSLNSRFKVKLRETILAFVRQKWL